MAVTIIIPTPLRQFAGGSAQLVFEANKVGEALDSLTTRYAELRKHLYNDQNALRSFVNVYVNDEDIRHAQALETPVNDGDTVMIVPSIAGGSKNKYRTYLSYRSYIPSVLSGSFLYCVGG